MSLRDTPTAYGTVSRLNHWIGAALVILMLGIGLYFHEMPRGDELRYWMGLHISIGALAAVWHALVERNRAATARMLGAPAR